MKSPRTVLAILLGVVCAVGYMILSKEGKSHMAFFGVFMGSVVARSYLKQPERVSSKGHLISTTLLIACVNLWGALTQSFTDFIHILTWSSLLTALMSAHARAYQKELRTQER